MGGWGNMEFLAEDLSLTRATKNNTRIFITKVFFFKKHKKITYLVFPVKLPVRGKPTASFP